MAGQVIGTYKLGIRGNPYLEAMEPLVRVSYADPDDDTADDGGLLVTPGIQFFFVGRNKIALNLDILLPESEDDGTEFSFRAQSSVHF